MQILVPLSSSLPRGLAALLQILVQLLLPRCLCKFHKYLIQFLFTIYRIMTAPHSVVVSAPGVRLFQPAAAGLSVVSGSAVVLPAAAAAFLLLFSTHIIHLS